MDWALDRTRTSWAGVRQRGRPVRFRMKILVISLAGIGDTILATPLLRELRANFPEACIDALVLWSGSKDVLEGNPHLNTVYQQNFLKASKAESLHFLAPLRRAGYDVSLNTHPQ